MNNPKFNKGDKFTSEKFGTIVIMSFYYNEREKQYIYAIEYLNYDSMLFGCYSEREILTLLGEINE